MEAAVEADGAVVLLVDVGDLVLEGTPVARVLGQDTSELARCVESSVDVGRTHDRGLHRPHGPARRAAGDQGRAPRHRGHSAAVPFGGAPARTDRRAPGAAPPVHRRAAARLRCPRRDARPPVDTRRHPRTCGPAGRAPRPPAGRRPGRRARGRPAAGGQRRATAPPGGRSSRFRRRGRRAEGGLGPVRCGYGVPGGQRRPAEPVRRRPVRPVIVADGDPSSPGAARTDPKGPS